VHDFRTLMDTIFTLFRMILGDFNFRDIERASTLLGPIYFLIYIFFVFFVLLNMFLAIINDTYGVVKERLKRQTPEFQMGDFFMTGVNNVKGALGIHDRGVDVENAIKMAAADDGFVTYEELRENLRAARFSDIEIDIFFHHFQNDPTISSIILDEEEVKAKELEKELARKNSVFEDEDQGIGSSDEEANARPLSGRQARRQRSARVMSAKTAAEKDDPVPDDDFYDLVGNVDKMEVAIAPLAQRIDAILARMGADNPEDEEEKSTKISKDMAGNMFDQIMNDQGGI